MAKGINGKRSGNTFERDWSRKLSLWITNNERDDCVWRTSNSGGRATVTGSDTQCGDLHAVRPEAHPFFSIFSIELKNYKPINLLHFDRPKFILYKWWLQAAEDAVRSNTVPMMIFNAKRLGQYFVIGKEDYFELNLKGYINRQFTPSPALEITPPFQLIEKPLLLRPIVQLFDFFDIIAINSITH